jgi:hypothetical protein
MPYGVSGYLIQLNQKEWDLLKSKFSTSIKGGKVKVPTAFNVWYVAFVWGLRLIIAAGFQWPNLGV